MSGYLEPIYRSQLSISDFVEAVVYRVILSEATGSSQVVETVVELFFEFFLQPQSPIGPKIGTILVFSLIRLLTICSQLLFDARQCARISVEQRA